MPWIRSCLCQQEKKRSPTISPPIHLLLKNEDSLSHGPNHAFRCKTFKKPRPCHLCHQPILNQGSCCRVCKYVCHKVCESKEAVQRYTDTSWQIHRQESRKNKKIKHVDDEKLKENDDDNDRKQQIVQIETEVEVAYEPLKNNIKITHTHDDLARNDTDMNRVDRMLISSGSHHNFGETLTTQPRSTRIQQHITNTIPGTMDLGYVTERIIALWFPSSTNSHSYRQGQRQAAHMLRNKHGDNYIVFNLSEPKRALRIEHKHVKEVGWMPGLAPPLEKLCSVCKEIESWLSADRHRIAVLHARGDKDKLGVIVAAYMHYTSICGNAEQALDRFSMRKFLDEHIGTLSLPSNKRYVDHFTGLLSHHIKINPAPLYLTHVTVLGAPSFEQGGCRAFLKLYEGQTPIYTSGIYNVSKGVSQFTVNVANERRRGLQLRGDILIRCYHYNEVGRETIFACQFHTCVVADYTLSFIRQELDVACTDPRFPGDGAVELHFSPGPEGRHPTPAPTPAVPFTFAGDDPIVRADSPLMIDEFDEDADSDSVSDRVRQIFGPLDGSIYATVAKKPELSPGAVSSPLTVSMDSGISSAGHQQNANTTASASPPPTAQPSPSSPEDQHRELDELLSDMMLTVQSIPDLKPQRQHFGLDENVRYIDEEDDKNIPYHARQDSRPFTYGVDPNMIGDTTKGLSSPSLVRKASVNRSTGDTLNKVQTQVYPGKYTGKPVPDFSNPPTYQSPSNYNTISKYGSYTPRSNGVTTSKHDDIDDLFTTNALKAQPIKREFREAYYKDERKRIDPMKRSFTDSTIRRSPERFAPAYSDTDSLSPKKSSIEFHEPYGTSNLTWLQKQQQKLRERRETQLRQERQPHETRLMSELRQVQTRHMRPTASHRLDGYTSDTTAFADDDDDYTIPLHINTLQKNGGPVGTSSYSKTVYAAKEERPFVAVKRAHERYAQNDPSQTLAANPFGQIIQNDDGLLSLVEQSRTTTPKPPSHTEQNVVGIERIDNSRIDALDGLIASLSSGSDKSSSSSSNNTSCAWQYREDSMSWRSQSVNETDGTSPSHTSSPRPQTPAFPVHARTPYASTPTVQFDLPSERLPPKSPTTQRRLSFPSTSNKITKKWSLSPERKDRPTSPIEFNGSEYSHSTITRYTDNYQSPKSPTRNGSASPTVYFGTSRRSSLGSESPHEVAPANVKFVRDTSKFWYKPTITREEAIGMLRDQPPGTFVVRDSNSFPGAFGLALKVSTIPNNIQTKSGVGDELIRHFLIEPTSRGVRLKGCQSEPVFSSLSALIYQHSVTPLALPCRLILPEGDLRTVDGPGSQAQQLLSQGAACNVLYLTTIDMESLTGPEAIKKATHELLQRKDGPDTAVVHFKVNGQGITLTDNKRKLFFRRHYPINTISHCGMDPEERRWNIEPEEKGVPVNSNRIFGFVARKHNSNNPDNQCHLFVELEPEQPAVAIVNFINKVLTSSGIKPNIV